MVDAPAVPVIAIDGPAASGKSTVARRVAERLGYSFLDTGAMYRAVTWSCLRAGVDLEDAAACERVAAAAQLEFDERGTLLVEGVARESEIRGEAVTAVVSIVAAHPGVRRAMVALQRRIAENPALRGLVAEGRDMTTVVFPASRHKFFLVASSAERARRRAAQLGRPAEAARIEAELRERDRLDSTRADSPLRRAEDACEIDTDPLAADEVVEAILTRVAGGAGGGC